MAAANNNNSAGSKYASKKQNGRRNVHPFNRDTQTKNTSKVIRFNDSNEDDHVSNGLLKGDIVTYKSVSYTHLDVYKRQKQKYKKFLQKRCRILMVMY